MTVIPGTVADLGEACEQQQRKADQREDQFPALDVDQGSPFDQHQHAGRGDEQAKGQSTDPDRNEGNGEHCRPAHHARSEVRPGAGSPSLLVDHRAFARARRARRSRRPAPCRRNPATACRRRAARHGRLATAGNSTSRRAFAGGADEQVERRQPGGVEPSLDRGFVDRLGVDAAVTGVGDKLAGGAEQFIARAVVERDNEMDAADRSRFAQSHQSISATSDGFSRR